MAKIQISESELKHIIRESVENVINEDGGFMYTPPAAPSAQAGNDRIGPGPSLTQDQAKTRNATANAALSSWNKLGTVGQIRAIQRLVGIPEKECDGKIGPQTLGKIYVALRKGQSGLENVNFRPGKMGTYTNI
jgi:hypothetical protein